jgi:hypothetical protein
MPYRPPNPNHRPRKPGSFLRYLDGLTPRTPPGENPALKAFTLSDFPTVKAFLIEGVAREILDAALAKVKAEGAAGPNREATVIVPLVLRTLPENRYRADVLVGQLAIFANDGGEDLDGLLAVVLAPRGLEDQAIAFGERMWARAQEQFPAVKPVKMDGLSSEAGPEIKPKWPPAPPPGFNKTQSLMALSMLRLVTEGDLPEEDWKLLHAQDKQGFSYEEFKARIKKAAPVFAHYIEHEYKAPPGSIPDLSGN